MSEWVSDKKWVIEKKNIVKIMVIHHISDIKVKRNEYSLDFRGFFFLLININFLLYWDQSSARLYYIEYWFNTNITREYSNNITSFPSFKKMIYERIFRIFWRVINLFFHFSVVERAGLGFESPDWRYELNSRLSDPSFNADDSYRILPNGELFLEAKELSCDRSGI